MCIAVCCNVCCSVLPVMQGVAVCCSVLQRAAVCCSVLHGVAVSSWHAPASCSTVTNICIEHYVAVFCSVLQWVRDTHPPPAPLSVIFVSHICRNFSNETVLFSESPCRSIWNSMGSGIPCPISTSAFCFCTYTHMHYYTNLRNGVFPGISVSKRCFSWNLRVATFQKASGQVFHVLFPLVLSV